MKITITAEIDDQNMITALQAFGAEIARVTGGEITSEAGDEKPAPKRNGRRKKAASKKTAAKKTKAPEPEAEENLDDILGESSSGDDETPAKTLDELREKVKEFADARSLTDLAAFLKKNYGTAKLNELEEAQYGDAFAKLDDELSEATA